MSSCDDSCKFLSLAQFSFELLCGTGRNLQGQSMGDDFKNVISLLDKVSTRSHIFVVSTPRIAPIGGTLIEVKPTLQLHCSCL